MYSNLISQSIWSLKFPNYEYHNDHCKIIYLLSLTTSHAGTQQGSKYIGAKGD